MMGCKFDNFDQKKAGDSKTDLIVACFPSFPYVFFFFDWYLSLILKLASIGFPPQILFVFPSWDPLITLINHTFTAKAIIYQYGYH